MGRHRLSAGIPRDAGATMQFRPNSVKGPGPIVGTMRYAP